MPMKSKLVCKYTNEECKKEYGSCMDCPLSYSKVELSEETKHRLLQEALEESKEDIIGHPNHYCEGRKYEPKDVIRDWNLNFNLGNAVKYISRNGRKDGNSALQDLKKARQYLDFEIEYLEKEGN